MDHGPLDLGLAVVLALDHRGVEGIDEVGLALEFLDRGVVEQGGVDVALDAGVDDEGVDGHEIFPGWYRKRIRGRSQVTGLDGGMAISVVRCGDRVGPDATSR